MKKKSFIAIIAILIIATTFAVMFTGCAKKVDLDQLLEQLTNGVRAAYGENNIDNIAITANAQLDIKKNKEKKPSTTFSIDLATQLDLGKDNAAKNGLKLVVKKNDEVLLGAWYKDLDGSKKLTKMYVQYKNASDGKDMKLNVSVPNVSQTLKDKNVTIDGDQVTKDIQAADIIGFASLFTILDNEKGSLLNIRQTKTKSTFSLPLTKILTPQKKAKNNSLVFDTILNASSTTDMLNPYMQALGVYLNTSDLGGILPNILVDFKISYDKKSGALTKVEIDLSLSKKTVKINSSTPNDDLETPGTENTDKPIISVGIPNDYKLKIAVSDVKIGPANLDMSTFNKPSDFGAGKDVSAVNFKTTGTITTSNDITVNLKDFDLGAVGGIIGGILGKQNEIKLPADTYTFTIEADVDPTLLLTENVSFSQNCTPFINGTDVQLKEVAGGGVVAKCASNYQNGRDLTTEEKQTLAVKGVNWKMNLEGQAELEKLIGTLMTALNYINIELHGAKGSNHQITARTSVDDQGTKKFKLTKFEALGLSIDVATVNLGSIIESLIGLIAPTTTKDNVETAAASDVKFDDTFIKANTPATPSNPNPTPTPPTTADPNGPGSLSWLKLYIAPIVQKLTVNMFGACASPDNWLEASLAKHTFQKYFDDTMVDYISLTIDSLTAGKNGINAKIIMNINPAITKEMDSTIHMIRSIIGGDNFTLELGLKSFVYGGCTIPTAA